MQLVYNSEDEVEWENGEYDYVRVEAENKA